MNETKNTVQKQVSGPQKNMQIDDFNKKHVASLIKEANNIAIIPSKIARADSFCASAGMYFMLKEALEDTKKNVKFVYSGKIPEECADIISENDLDTNLSDRELIISIDYSNTAANKVQYSTEEETLHLKISPVPKNFETSRIKAKIAGFEFDLVITVGAQELVDLGPIYNNLRQEINSAKKINIDNTKRNKRYGVVNIIDDEADSLSALIYKHSSGWDLVPNKKAAKALLTGISYRENTK